MKARCFFSTKILDKLSEVGESSLLHTLPLDHPRGCINGLDDSCQYHIVCALDRLSQQ